MVNTPLGLRIIKWLKVKVKIVSRQRNTVAYAPLILKEHASIATMC